MNNTLKNRWYDKYPDLRDCIEKLEDFKNGKRYNDTGYERYNNGL